MRRIANARDFSVLCIALMAALVAQAQPVVSPGGVLNAASYAVSGLPHSDIAQGSMFVVFGQRLGPAVLEQAHSFPFPTQLAGTSIHVTGGGVTADAVMIYTSAAQAAAILPSRIPPGEATITVTYINKTSAPARIKVAPSSFGIFTRNQAGSGPGIIQNYISPANQPVNARTDVARPGQVMILWGTGLGPVDFDETRPPEVRNLDVDLEVLVAGKSARVLYKGRSPQFPGIDQINFELPADVPEGCHVPLAVRAGTVVSNFATISVASSGGVCSDPIGLSAADMERARITGQLRAGSVNLEKLTILNVAPGEVEQAFSGFRRYEHAELLKAVRVGQVTLPFGTCSVISSAVGSGDPFSIHEDPTDPRGLGAGPVLNLNGPRGLKQIPREHDPPVGFYWGGLGGGIPGFTDQYGPEYLVPGVYTVDNGAGGSDVGPFRATLTLPAPTVAWTNQESITLVPRSQELTVTWSGGDPTKEYVIIQGLSTDTDLGVGAQFACTERASAGRFSIPALVLSSLPPSGTMRVDAQSVPTGLFFVSSVSILEPTRFQAQGLDVGSFGYVMSSVKFVGYR